MKLEITNVLYVMFFVIFLDIKEFQTLKVLRVFSITRKSHIDSEYFGFFKA